MRAKVIAVDRKDVFLIRLSWLFAASGYVIACRLFYGLIY